MSGHPWRMGYWPLNTSWPFNTGLTNLRVIQEHEDDEKVKYLPQDKKWKTN